MLHLIRKKDKTEKENRKSLPKRISPLMRIFAGEEASKEELEHSIAQSALREEQRRQEREKLRQQVLAQLGYENADLEQMRSDGYRRNMKNGVYVHDYSAPSGSIDNPREVGMEGCCTSLFFVPELGGWVLSDGLGNGVLR